MKRVDLLTAPAVIGRTYMVPTVRSTYHGFQRDWPVMGPEHTDKEFFDFDDPHYHIDARFVPARWLILIDPMWRAKDASGNYKSGDRVKVENHILSLQAAPLTGTAVGKGGWDEKLRRPIWEREPLPAPVYRPMRMARHVPDFHYTETKQVMGLQAHFAGQTCRKGKAGLICPHRNYRLGSQPAVDGVITCPLHGLRISAETGEVLR